MNHYAAARRREREYHDEWDIKSISERPVKAPEKFEGKDIFFHSNLLQFLAIKKR